MSQTPETPETNSGRPVQPTNSAPSLALQYKVTDINILKSKYSTELASVDAYSDEKVGLAKYRFKDAQRDKILEGTNFWILTHAPSPYIDGFNEFNSGKSYTTEVNIVKWFLKHKRWLVQGYRIAESDTERSVAELKRIITELDANPEWFGRFWPHVRHWTQTQWTPWGMSYNLRKECNNYHQGRLPITAGEERVSLTLQEAIAEIGEASTEDKTS